MATHLGTAQPVKVQHKRTPMGAWRQEAGAMTSQPRVGKRTGETMRRAAPATEIGRCADHRSRRMRRAQLAVARELVAGRLTVVRGG